MEGVRNAKSRERGERRNGHDEIGVEYDPACSFTIDPAQARQATAPAQKSSAAVAGDSPVRARI